MKRDAATMAEYARLETELGDAFEALRREDPATLARFRRAQDQFLQLSTSLVGDDTDDDPDEAA